MKPIMQRLDNIARTKQIAGNLKGKVSYSILIQNVISSLQVTRRTAMEYLETATFELGFEKDDFR